jgi:8-oxo-dGTP diphosphatase
MPEHFEVAIALLWREGRLLITRRRHGTHLAGLWEFPGGQMLAGESAERCAEREVLEEVGVRCHAVGRRGSIAHDYAERSVVLHPIDCTFESGEPEAREVSAFAWVHPTELGAYAFPEANSALLAELAAGAPGSPR